MTREISSEEEYESILLQMLGKDSEIDCDKIDDILANGFGADISRKQSQEESIIDGFDFESMFSQAMEEDHEPLEEKYENLTILLDVGDNAGDFEVPLHKQEEKKSYTRKSVLNIKDQPKDKTQIPIPRGITIVRESKSNEIVYEEENKEGA